MKRPWVFQEPQIVVSMLSMNIVLYYCQLHAYYAQLTYLETSQAKENKGYRKSHLQVTKGTQLLCKKHSIYYHKILCVWFPSSNNSQCKTKDGTPTKEGYKMHAKCKCNFIRYCPSQQTIQCHYLL